MGWINQHLRGRQVTKRIVFGGGYPLFRLFPRIVRWGTNVSIYWLGTELVFLGARQ